MDARGEALTQPVRGAADASDMKVLGVLVLVGVVVGCSTEQASEGALATTSETRAPKADASDASTGPVATAPPRDASTAAAPDAPAADTSYVAASCNAMFARGTACGAIEIPTDTVAAVCDAFGKNMKPEVATMFDCEADAICSGDLSSCVGPTPTTLGDDLCQGIASTCGGDVEWFDCTSEGRDEFDNLGGELTAEATTAGESCLQGTCADLRSCLDAWQTTVGLPPLDP